MGCLQLKCKRQERVGDFGLFKLKFVRSVTQLLALFLNFNVFFLIL